MRAPPRQLLHRFAIPIACRLVHVGIRADRIAPQDPLHAADAFDERGPIQRGQHAHGVDDVGNRELLYRLPVLLQPQHLVGRLPARIQSGLQPAPGGCGGDRLIAQVVKNLDDERRRGLGGELKRRIRLLRRAQQLGGKRARGLSFLLRSERLHGERAEALQHRKPQHDGNGPELPNRERRDILIGLGEAAQRLLVEAPRGMRHEISCEDVHARVTPPASGRQRRKLFVILPWKVTANLQHLRAHHIVVVAQPFLRGGFGVLTRIPSRTVSCRFARGARRCGRASPAVRAVALRRR